MTYAVCTQRGQRFPSNRGLEKHAMFYRMFYSTISRACAVYWVPTRTVPRTLDLDCVHSYITLNFKDDSHVFNYIRFHICQSYITTFTIISMCQIKQLIADTFYKVILTIITRKIRSAVDSVMRRAGAPDLSSGAHIYKRVSS